MCSGLDVLPRGGATERVNEFFVLRIDSAERGQMVFSSRVEFAIRYGTAIGDSVSCGGTWTPLSGTGHRGAGDYNYWCITSSTKQEPAPLLFWSSTFEYHPKHAFSVLDSDRLRNPAFLLTGKLQEVVIPNTNAVQRKTGDAGTMRRYGTGQLYKNQLKNGLGMPAGYLSWAMERMSWATK